jgi:hypothetical protein
LEEYKIMSTLKTTNVQTTNILTSASVPQISLSSSTVTFLNSVVFSSASVTGDILYASASGTLTRLAGVATGNALISGGVGAIPSWGKIGLTTHISGTLPIANGGTNATGTPTQGGIAYGTGSAYAFTSAGTIGQVLTSNGTSAPTWQQAASGGLEAFFLSGM